MSAFPCLASRFLVTTLFRKQIYSSTKQQQRFGLFGYLFGKSKIDKTMSNTTQQLEQEKRALEQKVHELVRQLDSQKGPNEAKVPEDLIIRSKEEQEANAALEQLKINEETKSVPVPSTKASDNASKKQQQGDHKGKQQKGGAASSKEPPAPEKPVDVSRLDLRIGKIIEVGRHPDADALYVEKIDCGDPTGPRTVISGLVNHVPIEEMKDRNVVVLCNLKPAKMRGILSEAMVMCASTPEKVEILETPQNVKPGDRVFFDNYTGEPDAQLNPKKKIWEQVSIDLKTNDDGVAMYKECEFKIAGIEGNFKSNLKNVQIR